MQFSTKMTNTFVVWAVCSMLRVHNFKTNYHGFIVTEIMFSLSSSHKKAWQCTNAHKNWWKLDNLANTV